MFRHPGESRGPVPRAAGLKTLDSGPVFQRGKLKTAGMTDRGIPRPYFDAYAPIPPLLTGDSAPHFLKGDTGGFVVTLILPKTARNDSIWPLVTEGTRLSSVPI